MEKIFISYRRDDSAGSTGRISDRLIQQFGTNKIFMDVNSIELGENFENLIEESVDSCNVLIAIIGKQWLNELKERQSDNAPDYVKTEIASALKKNIIVIPTLVDGAPLPGNADLPDDLVQLLSRNAINISHSNFDSDVNTLMSSLEETINRGNSISIIKEYKDKLKKDEFIGRVAKLKETMEDEQKVLTFLVEETDDDGNRTNRTYVEMKGSKIKGMIDDGDHVLIKNKRKNGNNIKVDKLQNLTEGIEVIAKDSFGDKYWRWAKKANGG